MPRKQTRPFMIITLIVLLIFCYSGISIAQVKIIDKSGIYTSKNSACKVKIERSPMGGHLVLFEIINNKLIPIKEDIVNAIWLNDYAIVIAGSPMYGIPGIFSYNCITHKLEVILSAKNKDQYYPDGADYFYLRDIVGKTIVFYYWYDADRMSMSDLLKDNNLYRVSIDGTGFSKYKE